MVVSKWYFPKPMKICSWDPKEIWDDGLQGYGYSDNNKFEAIEWWLLEIVDVTLYRQIIGSLMYLTNTRPNVCFAVNTLS